MKYFSCVLLLFFIYGCGGGESTPRAQNCEEGAENSILQECLDAGQICDVIDKIAVCGDCRPGYRTEGDQCIKIQGCSDLNCGAENRFCDVGFDPEDDSVCSDCLNGFKLLGESCVSVAQCDDLECTKEYRHCLEAGKHSDAECGRCLDYYKTDGENCLAITSCEDLGCDLANRVCIQLGPHQDETCSTYCKEGFRDQDGECLEILDCQRMRCNNKNRVCIQSSPFEDATCGRCLGGYHDYGEGCKEITYTVCDPEPAEGSIVNECSEEHRTCIPGINGARSVCGACFPGYQLVDGRCLIENDCAMLNCGDLHRSCDSVLKTDHKICGGCLGGFQQGSDGCQCKKGTILDWKTGVCELIKSCDDLECSDGMNCIDATETTHAYCSRCEAGEAWDGDSCKQCSITCNGDGETGNIFPITSGVHCICETKPGYFNSESTHVTIACDEDQDGWVTEKARLAIDAAVGSADYQNAKCNLKKIDRFMLVNEHGQKRTISISSLTGGTLHEIALYEAESRDSQVNLEKDYVSSSKTFAPAYGVASENGERLYFKAEQLNMLTKAVPAGSNMGQVDQADYNANGVPDIQERPWDTTKISSVADIFMNLSYFMELYRGGYSKDPDQQYGAYVIKEMSRSANGFPEMSIPLTLKSGNDYWRQCYRKRDRFFNDSSGTGLDFARFHYSGCQIGDLDSWCGMNHHSQFKPLQVVEIEDPLNPYTITPKRLKRDYMVNICSSKSELYGPLGGSGLNPSAPVITCELIEFPEDSDLLPEPLKKGMLVWGISKFQNYDNNNQYYSRGCINECIDMGLLPEDQKCSGGGACTTAPGDAGRLLCTRGIVMHRIVPGGTTFTMGREPLDEDPPEIDETPHGVRLTQPFEISTTEIDQLMFETVMRYNPSYFSCGRASCPVEQVSWYDAAAFANRYTELFYGSSTYNCYEFTKIECNDGKVYLAPTDITFLNSDSCYCQDNGGIKNADVKRKGHTECKGFRLPTEAEFEFSAKGRNYTCNYYTPFNSNECPVFGHNIMWNIDSSDGRTMTIGLKEPNKYVLFDMLGNVAEWVGDSYSSYPITTIDAPDVDPSTLPNEIEMNKDERSRVIRGGSFQDKLYSCENSARAFDMPSSRSNHIGFRLARSEVAQQCRRYLTASDLTYAEDTILEAEQPGKYSAQLIIDDSLSYTYEEIFIDSFSKEYMKIETVYDSQDDFLRDLSVNKQYFDTRKVTVTDLDGSREYDISVDTVDNYLTVLIEGNSFDNYKAKYSLDPKYSEEIIESDGSPNLDNPADPDNPENKLDGTVNLDNPYDPDNPDNVPDSDNPEMNAMNTEECIGIRLKLSSDLSLDQTITEIYTYSIQRVQDDDYDLTLDKCRLKKNIEHKNIVDTNGNYLIFNWFGIETKIKQNIFNGYISECKE